VDFSRWQLCSDTLPPAILGVILRLQYLCPAHVAQVNFDLIALAHRLVPGPCIDGHNFSPLLCKEQERAHDIP
jgi:hypothetical protein